MRRLFPLFILIPAVELLLLILSGRYIGVPLTLLIIILTGVIGYQLARKQGLTILIRVREELSYGHLPGETMLEGLLVFIGGLFLLFPGYLTDLCGFLLLIPPIRFWVVVKLQRWLKKQFINGNFTFTFRR